jgi:hypothetical protein
MAPPLHWTIGQSKLPGPLKTTLYTLALVADQAEGWSNIWLSKRSIGAMSGFGERAAREHMADLVFFGVLTIVQQSRGGPGKKQTQYQLWLDQIGAWTEAETAAWKERRAARRHRTIIERKAKVSRSVQPGSRDPGCGSGRAGLTRIQGSGQPGSVDPANPDPGIRGSVRTDPENVCTVDERGSASGHAVENSAASVAVSPEAVSPTRTPDPGGPPVRGRFRLLAEIGYRSLAGYGMGDVPWFEVRRQLRSRAVQLGIPEDRELGELLDRVIESLGAQRRHFLSGAQGDAAAP